MAAAKKSGLSNLNLPGKLAVGGLLLLLPWLVFYVIFYSEIEAEIAGAQSTNQRLAADLQSAERAERAYQRDLQELGARERNRRELMKVLPETTEYPAFLSTVQNVANLVGVELVAWTPQAEVVEEFYARVPMRLELRGRFHQLAKFFYNVGQSERIINMDNIALTSAVQQEDGVLLNATVLATAFHALKNEPAASPAAQSRRNRTR